MHQAQELVASLDRLSSLPGIYYRVRQALDDPDTSLDQIAGLIGTDPALSLGLLRMANSALYGFPRRIETLPRAIALIGLKPIGDLLLGSSIAAQFAGIHPAAMDMPRFWRSSVRAALLCRGIGEARGKGEGERLFLLGLLADLGHLVMYQAIPDLADIILEDSAASLDVRAERERSLIGCDFAEVSAALANSWRLPLSLGVPLGAQLRPEQAGEFAPQAACIRLVRQIDEWIEDDTPLDEIVEALDASLLSLTGIERDSLPPLIGEAEALLQEMLHAMGFTH